MNTTLPQQMLVRVIKQGWYKRTYELVGNDRVYATLRYEKFSYTTAVGRIKEREFTIRRSGFWKHFIEIRSSFSPYNHRYQVNWRNALKITDDDGNPFVFKPSGIWQTKWQWLDRHERPMIEIKSKPFSKSNRAIISIFHHDLKDSTFWITVAWFAILCSESDAGIVVAS